jgi:2-C-methyl-D-erythritol 4-phosphate cytidylyltransferase
MRTAVVVLAAGAGTRVGGEVNKVLMPLRGVPVVAWSVRTARLVPGVARVVLVVRDGEQDAVRAAVEPHLDDREPDVEMVTGGETRHRSEWSAISLLAPAIEAGELDVVAMHDAARPLAGVGLYDRVIDAAARVGGAIPVAPLADLVTADGGDLPGDPSGGGGRRLVGVQTPQAFRASALLAAHRRAQADGFEATDTAAIIATYTDLAVAAVDSDEGNLKLTVAADFRLAEALTSV